MKKKILLAVLGAVSVVSLAACSGNSNTEIATMKGGKVTVSEFYDKAKTDQNSQQMVFNMILSEVFMNKYGEKVTDKMVDEQLKIAFGDNVDEQLKAANMTRKEVEQTIKENLALQEGLKAHVKLTDEDLKTAWDSFHPEVETQMIAVTSEDDAKAIQKDASKKDADFGKIAAEKSILPSKEDKGKVKFDSTTAATEVPEEVKQAAWGLKDGEVSDVIPVNSAYGSSFYIVKMVKTQAKGNDMDKYKDKVKEIATDAKLADQAFTQKAIGEELIDANVKIKDEAFSNILSSFTDAAQPEKKSTDDKKDDKKTEDTKSESTDESK
ncbi:peptidyl-prolyl cis-trans isomerase [Enterococcus saccharolyticus]|uniref:peptidylprolyl isomerase n=1 Tax=Enterococcus TaxID=1350 RepID=UPI001E501C14|nr:peptidylprolyl isomerase [Enterococcus saccharolyticus]MCD5001315.1 peptidyl-prolyl cis-trans isomerase [Enterococcus saccharolyticus]